MCSNLRLSKSKNIVPGSSAIYKIYTDKGWENRFGKFGLQNGTFYNCKSEKLSTTWEFISLNRGYIEVIGFQDHGAEVELPNEQPMKLAILFNEKQEFAVLTEASTGPLTMVHFRMPVIIDDTEFALSKWITEGKIIHLNANHLQLKNKRA